MSPVYIQIHGQLFLFFTGQTGLNPKRNIHNFKFCCCNKTMLTVEDIISLINDNRN